MTNHCKTSSVMKYFQFEYPIIEKGNCQGRVNICETPKHGSESLEKRRSAPHPCLGRHSAVCAFNDRPQNREALGGPIEADDFWCFELLLFQTTVGKTDTEFTFIRFAPSAANGQWRHHASKLVLLAKLTAPRTRFCDMV